MPRREAQHTSISCCSSIAVKEFSSLLPFVGHVSLSSILYTTCFERLANSSVPLCEQPRQADTAILFPEPDFEQDNIDVCVRVLVAGVAVSSMMFGTTVLTYMVMLMIWETNFFLATAFLLGFGFVDMVFTTGLHHHSLPLLLCLCGVHQPINLHFGL